MKKLLVVFIALVIVAGIFVIFKSSDDEPQNTDKSQLSDFNQKRYSVSEPSSLWVVVNKKRPLPASYAPTNLVDVGNGELLRQDAAAALAKLKSAAAKDGLGLRVISGYRSYSTQESLYNNYTAQDGQDNADTYSARPGHSEHQTGLGVDLGNPDASCDLDKCFGNTPAGKWLANNAYKYGFIVRYREGWENIVGYQAEPWHLRFVGVELAKQLQKTNQTIEEFFGLSPAPNY